MVGMMRGGRLLAEDKPNALLQRHSMPTLEQVFLALCLDSDAESTVEPSDGFDPAAPGDTLMLTGLARGSWLHPEACGRRYQR